MEAPEHPPDTIMSTRSLNALYRQSHGDAFFAHMQPSMPWLEQPPSRAASWESGLSAAAASDSALPPRLKPAFRSDRASIAPSIRSRAYSSTSRTKPVVTQFGLDLTDPWGNAFDSSSPYDIVENSMLRPLPLPSRSMSRTSFSTASSSQSHAWADRSPDPPTLYKVPSTSSAPPCGSSSPESGQLEPPRSNLGVAMRDVRKAASLGDLPSHNSANTGLTKPAVGRSKLQHVRVSEDDVPPYVESNKKYHRLSRWFLSKSPKGKGTNKPASAPNQTRQPPAPLPLPAEQTRNTHLRAPEMATPPLSDSTSSTASSSIDTNVDTILDDPLPHGDLPLAHTIHSIEEGGAKLIVRSVNPGQASPQKPNFLIQEPRSASLSSTHVVSRSPSNERTPPRVDNAGRTTPPSPFKTPAASPHKSNSLPTPPAQQTQHKQRRLSFAFMRTKKASVPPVPEKSLPVHAIPQRLHDLAPSPIKVGADPFERRPSTRRPASPPGLASGSPQRANPTAPPNSSASSFRPTPARTSSINAASAIPSSRSPSPAHEGQTLRARKASTQFRKMASTLPSPESTQGSFTPALASSQTMNSDGLPAHPPSSPTVHSLPAGARAQGKSSDEASTLSWPGSLSQALAN